MRDEFSKSTINNLRKRAGENCSNPDCRTLTCGAGGDANSSISIGVAAHIEAASPGGPRYNAHMSSKERKALNNAIWLCQNCSKLIDSDKKKYTPELLISWRTSAEAYANERIAKRIPVEARQPSMEQPPFLIETLELGDNNLFHGKESDIKNLATRIAINAINGKEVKFNIRLNPTVLKIQPTDPLTLPKYEAARARKAALLSDCLNTLLLQNVYKCFKYFLSSVDEWEITISTLIHNAKLEFSSISSVKIDVWRTTPPKTFCAIYITDDEMELLLSHLGFTKRNELAMGAGWRNVLDMPHGLIVKYIIPKVIVHIVDNNIPLEDDLLNFGNWHIGLG